MSEKSLDKNVDFERTRVTPVPLTKINVHDNVFCRAVQPELYDPFYFTNAP